jgi:filamentous hemagglutinin
MAGVHGQNKLSGAGGNWPTINEAADPSVIRQLTPNACGNACGEMLLRSRGVSGVSQSNIAAVKRLVLSDGKGLADAMNKLHPGGQWRGGTIDVFTDPRGAFNALNKSGPFLTSMKSYGTNLHMVVVDGLDNAGRVIIRDPWGNGSRYVMSWDDFTKHWMGDTVWWGGK